MSITTFTDSKSLNIIFDTDIVVKDEGDVHRVQVKAQSDQQNQPHLYGWEVEPAAG